MFKSYLQMFIVFIYIFVRIVSSKSENDNVLVNVSAFSTRLINNSTNEVPSIISKRKERAKNSIWNTIEMPKKSYFAGMNVPKDPIRWNQARISASLGQQVLLKQVHKQINASYNLFANEKKFKWMQKFADECYTKENGWLKGLKDLQVRQYTSSDKIDTYWISQLYKNKDLSKRSPIILLGKRYFTDEGSLSGKMTKWEKLDVNDIITKGNLDLPRPIVAMGLNDENWGWLSSYFLNRTINWGMSFGKSANTKPDDKNFLLSNEYRSINKFLDNENLLMLAVNTHHNFSHHPKVISLPLGLRSESITIWNAGSKALLTNMHKEPENLMNTLSSSYAFRPQIRECVETNMMLSKYAPDLENERNNGNYKHHNNHKNQHRKKKQIKVNKMGKRMYIQQLLSSIATLCLPGLGADTYRLWESLALGVMPVVERGMGLDRTLYKLPALLVDDYIEISPFMIRQAYVEALYHAEQWEYKRMSRRYWENLMMNVSVSNSIQPLMDAHPMHAVDLDFTRPIVPFECNRPGKEKCGKGTKRTPIRSCAIDEMKLKNRYNWFYLHS